MKKKFSNGQVLSEKEMKQVKGGNVEVKPINESLGTRCPVCSAEYEEHGYYEEDYSTNLHAMFCLKCGSPINKE